MGRDEPSLEPSGGDLGGVHLAVPSKLGEWILVRCFPAKPRTGIRPKASKGRLPDLGVCALSQSHPEPSLLLFPSSLSVAKQHPGNRGDGNVQHAVSSQLLGCGEAPAVSLL